MHPERWIVSNNQTNKYVGMTFALCALMALPAFAQTAAPAQQLAPAAGTPAAVAAAPVPAKTAAADAAALVGKPLHDMVKQPLGTIAAVSVGKNGWVSSVQVQMPAVSGAEAPMLSIPWQELRIAVDGTLVTTLDQAKLAALPKVRDVRGSGVQAAADAPPTIAPPAPGATPPKPEGVPTKDVIGATVVDTAQQPIGRVYDLTLDGNGVAQSLVIARADPLGLSTEGYSEVAFSDVKITRQGEQILVTAPVAAAQMTPNTQIRHYQGGRY